MIPALTVDVVNMSARVTERECRAMIAGCLLQLTEHFSPAWDRAPLAVNYVGAGQAGLAAARPYHVLCLLLDQLDAPDALGYHTEEKGQKVVKIGVGVVLDNGGTVLGDSIDPNAPCVSSVLSHELLELAGDPSVNLYADGPDNRSYAVELCDAVESTGYAVNVADPDDWSKALTVVVSDFLLPTWFDPQSTSGPWSFRGAAPAAFMLAVGGYSVVRSGGPGTEGQVFGDLYPAWRRPLKQLPSSRSGRRCGR